MISKDVSKLLEQAMKAAAEDNQSRTALLEQASTDLANDVSQMLYGDDCDRNLSDNPLIKTADEVGRGWLSTSCVTILDDAFAKRSKREISAADFESLVALGIAMAVMTVSLDREASAEALKD